MSTNEERTECPFCQESFHNILLHWTRSDYCGTQYWQSGIPPIVFSTNQEPHPVQPSHQNSATTQQHVAQLQAGTSRHTADQQGDLSSIGSKAVEDCESSSTGDNPTMPSSLEPEDVFPENEIRDQEVRESHPAGKIVTDPRSVSLQTVHHAFEESWYGYDDDDVDDNDDDSPPHYSNNPGAEDDEQLDERDSQNGSLRQGKNMCEEEDILTQKSKQLWP